MNGIRYIRAVFGDAFHIFLGELCALCNLGYDLLIVISDLQLFCNSAPELTTAASEFAPYSNFLLFFWLLVFNFYAMSLLLNVAIAIKNKNAVIEIPNMAVTKTLLTVKDVKDCSNRKLSGKSHFAKFTVLPIVDCNSSKNRPQKQTTMVIPADRSGLLTTSETEKAIALIRNSVYVPKTICKKQLVP